MVPYKSLAEEVSFEWSHYRISSTDSNVRITWLFYVHYMSHNWLWEWKGNITLNGHVIQYISLFSFGRAFGGSSNLRIPHWGGIHGCLIEYLPLIQELFAEKVICSLLAIEVQSKLSKTAIFEQNFLALAERYPLWGGYWWEDLSEWIKSWYKIENMTIVERLACVASVSVVSARRKLQCSSPLFDCTKVGARTKFLPLFCSHPQLSRSQRAEKGPLRINDGNACCTGYRAVTVAGKWPLIIEISKIPPQTFAFTGKCNTFCFRSDGNVVLCIK